MIGDNSIVDVKLWINEDNSAYLLNGYNATNSHEDIMNMISKYTKENGFIYKRRLYKYDSHSTFLSNESEYPNVRYGDIVIGKIVAINPDENTLKVELIDTLYYSHLVNPVIRINGLCIINSDDNTFNITKITRLTMSDSDHNPIVDTALL